MMTLTHVRSVDSNSSACLPFLSLIGLIAKSEEVIAAGAESSALRIQLETESHAARTTKEKATQEREEFETIIESLKTKVSTLREELVTAKEISADAKRVADSEKVKCREATAAMKALELKLSRTENSSTAAADQVSELSSNVELLQRDLGTANDRIKAESARAMAVEGDHGRVVAKCEKLEGRVHELQTQLDAVHERLKKEQVFRQSPLTCVLQRLFNDHTNYRQLQQVFSTRRRQRTRHFKLLVLVVTS